MPNDLKDQLRALVDTAPPVTAEEAITRAEAYPSELAGGVRSTRHLLRPMTVAASAVLLAGAGIGFAVASNSNSPKVVRGPVPTVKQQPKVILTAAQVNRITTRSAAAAATSGTAKVTQTSSMNGIVQNGYDTAVAFSGADIDEKITSIPEPPGSSKAFTTDDRLVDGQFYIYTPGPGDVLEWLHNTNSGDNPTMQFPDPRTLYGAISPQAQFAVAGTTTMNGETVTHLVAGDPAAITTAALGNLATGTTPTSFELWVDANEVVQQMSLSTSSSSKECGRSTPMSLQPLTAKEKKELAPYERAVVNGEPAYNLSEVPASVLKHIPGEKCGTQTSSSSATITFADLGIPQSITAPAGAVDFSGKG